MRTGLAVRVAGLVLCRQRPLTASGVTFVTIEDESGPVNLIVWPRTAEIQRQVLLRSNLLLVSGVVQNEEKVLHVVVSALKDLGSWFKGLDVEVRDFR